MNEEHERVFKGIWIPAKLWLTKELKIMEKLFLVEINSLDNEEGCWATNHYFADFFGISKPRCSQIIKSLQDKGFISIQYERKGKEIVKRTIKMKIIYKTDVVNKLNTVVNKRKRVLSKSKQGIKKMQTGCLENAKENNTTNNTTNNTKNNMGVEIPSSLSTSNNFTQAWDTWTQYRKEIKKSLSPTTAFAQLSKLEKVGPDTAVEMIKQSIENGWQGLFDVKRKKYQNSDNYNKAKELLGI